MYTTVFITDTTGAAKDDIEFDTAGLTVKLALGNTLQPLTPQEDPPEDTVTVQWINLGQGLYSLRTSLDLDNVIIAGCEFGVSDLPNTKIDGANFLVYGVTGMAPCYKFVDGAAVMMNTTRGEIIAGVLAGIPPQPSLISTYLGDLPRQGEHFFYKFHTLLNGVPASLTGVTLEIYKDGDLPVDMPEGVTILTDFGGVAGLNQIDFDLAAPLYTDHANYTVGFAGGMLGGVVNMAGITIASFSILQRMCRINWSAIDRTSPS